MANDQAWLWLAPLLGLLPIAVVMGRGVTPGPPDDAPIPVATQPDPPRRRAAVVVNPSKFDDLTGVIDTVTDRCRRHGWADPVILETTAEDPGTGQTRQALRDGVDLVMACGGDGTVRTVAEVIAAAADQGGPAMAILPGGTGNLLARNLELPIDDLAAAVDVALTGRELPIDVGWLRLDDDPELAFLVMAGMGFDAEIMDDAPEKLKAVVGPAAYVLAGIRKLNGPRERITLRVDDGPPVHRRIRSVLIGNCGKIQAGIELMPDAKVDDGRLDVVSLAPKGVVGWAAVVGQFITHRHRGHRRVEHFQGETVTVHAVNPITAQIDGDPVGQHTRLKARVQPRVLRLLTPIPLDEEAADRLVTPPEDGH